MAKYQVEFKEIKPWLVKFKVNGVWFMLHESAEIDAYGVDLYRIYMDNHGWYQLRNIGGSASSNLRRCLRKCPDLEGIEVYTPKSQISVPFFLGWLDALGFLSKIHSELRLEHRIP